MPRRKGRRSPSSVSVAKKTSQVIGRSELIFGWCFHHYQQEGPFSFSDLRPSDWRILLERLRGLDALHLPGLRSAGCHRVEIGNIVAEAQRQLQHLDMDDAELWSFRITGERRFWCIKTLNIFSLLWWDPHHRVYPSPR